MNVDAKQIKKIIESEIANSEIDNWHGISRENIAGHLRDPILEEYVNSFDEPKTLRLWTVLEELPHTEEGYTIYYDPDKKKFGLGLKAEKQSKVALGIYGSFITTLNGM